MPLYTGQEFTKIFAFDGSSTYTDVTLEAQTPAGTSFAILGAAAHYLYLGHDERFDMAIFDVDVPAVIGALTWQYYNGSAWTTFVPASVDLYMTQTYQIITPITVLQRMAWRYSHPIY